jgi:transposase InsO family protein
VTIQTDKGSEVQAAFHWHILDRGLKHTCIRPVTPRLTAKHRTLHRIDVEEFYRLLEGVVIDDSALFTDRLQEWENFYNFHRPRRPGRADSYERLLQKAQTGP